MVVINQSNIENISWHISLVYNPNNRDMPSFPTSPKYRLWIVDDDTVAHLWVKVEKKSILQQVDWNKILSKWKSRNGLWLGMKWKCDKITSSNQKPKRKGKNLRVTYNTFFFSYRTITPRACLLEEGRLAWSCGIDLMVMLLGFDISLAQSQIVLPCQNLISEFQTLTIKWNV